MKTCLIARIAFLALTCCFVSPALAQVKPGSPKGDDVWTAEPVTMPLWEHGAPGALGNGPDDQPTITYYPPLEPAKSATAVVVLPGGGYAMLASNHEGRQMANWLNGMGVSAFVVKYRLGPKYHHPIELGDAQRAIRFVRAHAADYEVKSDRIGIMGFSAGGHLASTTGTHFDSGNASAGDATDRVSSRPDFLILGYPVITMKEPHVHHGSAEHLMGEHPDPALRDQLSNELQVTTQTPPTFLFTSSNDDVVDAENSVLFYLALQKAKVPAELHVFEKAPHGVGLDLNDPAMGEWSTLLRNWLLARGLLAK